MYLIVGLGNPGEKYTFTRHNVGFLFIDYLCQKTNTTLNKQKFRGLYAKTRLKGEEVIVVKPQTFMNLSGECVRDICAFYKIPPEKVIVVHDDTALHVGSLRIRSTGSDGGHNGIKSIIYSLGENTFTRCKVGVGAPPRKDYDLADWVLGGFLEEEKKEVYACITNVYEAVELIVQGKLADAMNRYTKTVKPPTQGKTQEDGT